MAKADSALLKVARRALHEWDFSVAQIEHTSTSENTVFRVDTDDGKTYALRIHRPGYHSLAELNAEQQWTAALHQAGIEVPAPYLTRDGRGYARVCLPGSTETRYVGIVEWVDGALLGRTMKWGLDERTLVLRFEQLGRIAARIHNQAVNWQIPSGFQRHSFDADGLMGDAPFWGPFWELPQLTDAERKHILNARSSLYSILSDIGKEQETYSLIHADLHPHNLLVSDNKLYAIDFDDAGFGWHQYELAVALFHDQGKPHFDAIREALIAGYRSERDLDDATLELLPVFLLIRALALLGWIHGRPELGSSKRLPRLIEMACAQAEDLSGHFDSL